MLTDLRLEVTIWERSLRSLFLLKHPVTWIFTPAEYMTDDDVYLMAQRFIKAGADVNVVEERECVSVT